MRSFLVTLPVEGCYSCRLDTVCNFPATPSNPISIISLVTPSTFNLVCETSFVSSVVLFFIENLGLDD